MYLFLIDGKIDMFEQTNSNDKMDTVPKQQHNETNGLEASFVKTHNYNRCGNVDDNEGCSIAKQLRQKSRKSLQSSNRKTQPFKLKAHKVGGIIKINICQFTN